LLNLDFGIIYEENITFEEFIVTTFGQIFNLPEGEYNSLKDLLEVLHFMMTGNIIDIEDDTVLLDVFFPEYEDMRPFVNAVAAIAQNKEEGLSITLNSRLFGRNVYIEEVLINGEAAEFEEKGNGFYTINFPSLPGKYVVRIVVKYDGPITPGLYYDTHYESYNGGYDEPEDKWGIIYGEPRESTCFLFVKIIPNDEALLLNAVVNGQETEIDQESKTVSASIENFDPETADVKDLQSSFNSTVDLLVREGDFYFVVTAEDGVTKNEYLFVNTYEPPVTDPPETEEPVTEPTETEPPVTEPSDTEPTKPEPTETEPPVSGDYSGVPMMILSAASLLSAALLHRKKRR